MKLDLKKNRKFWIPVLVIVLTLALAAGALACYLTRQGQKQEQQSALLQERPVQNKKSDTVTAEGSVSVGTVSQTFDMDLSEFTGSDSSQFSWNMGMSFPQMNMGGSQSSSGSRQLIVEEVYVKVGEEVTAGDPILKVTADTLEQIRQGLNGDVTDAKTAYDQMLTRQNQTEKEASAALKENELYGKYADTEYNLAVAALEETVLQLQEQLEENQEKLAEAQTELSELQASLEEQNTVLENAAYTVENEDRSNNTYGWLTAVNAKVDVETMIENLELEIEEKEDSILMLEKETESISLQLAQAQKERETGMIEAESTKKARQINSENAQEIYDVTTQLAAFETQNAKEDYERASARLTELDTYLANRLLCAQGDGVITAVSIRAGDSLQENTELIALNSYDDVTITLTIEGKDMDAAALNSQALVTFPAFPDEIFDGRVTEIKDAQIDSNTNTTTYEVVVTILENGSKLYEGMSAEVTFYRTQEETVQ